MCFAYIVNTAIALFLCDELKIFVRKRKIIVDPLSVSVQQLIRLIITQLKYGSQKKRGLR